MKKEKKEKELPDVQADVKWATSADDFLPFTSLPKRYHNKVVQLVIVGDWVQRDKKKEPLESIDEYII